MPKLKDAKIRWIIREMKKGECTQEEIGQVQGVTRQRVSTYKKYLWYFMDHPKKMHPLAVNGNPLLLRYEASKNRNSGE